MSPIIERLSDVVIWFAIYSAAGWVYETTLVSMQQKRFVNRGFVNGPLCPIYGCGAVLAALLLADASLPDWAVFLLSGTVACLLEYVTSIVMEQAFHARWWDYSSYKFNYQGRVCLLGFLAFGVAGVAIVEYAQPAVKAVTDCITWPWKPILAASIAVATMIDFTVTVIGTYGLDKTMTKIHDAMRAMEGSTAGRAMTSIKSSVSTRARDRAATTRSASLLHMLNSQQRRMLDSFPHLKLHKVEDGLIADLRTMLADKARVALSRLDRPSMGIEALPATGDHVHEAERCEQEQDTGR